MFPWQFQIKIFKKSIVIELREEGPLNCPKLLKVSVLSLSMVFLTVFVSVKIFFFINVTDAQCKMFLACILVIVSEGKEEIDSCHFMKWWGAGGINSYL